MRSPATEAAQLVPQVGLVVGAAVEHLVLDGLVAGGLFPVVGTLSLSDPATQEALTSLDVTFNVLTPGGQVVGRALPGGTSRRFYHTDLLGTVRAVVTESGALAEHRAYDAWGVALAGRLTSPEAGTAEGFTGKPRLGGTASGGAGRGARRLRDLDVRPGLRTLHPD